MIQKHYRWILAGMLAAILPTAGCVERRLTIVTEPENAVVWLNDEEVGTTPVTVNFNWYGDYTVRIEKSGYAILNTHRELERPTHDKFPYDFFAEVLWPKQIVDEYTWAFQLQPYEQTAPEALIEAAQEMSDRADRELGAIAQEVLEDSGATK